MRFFFESCHHQRLSKLQERRSDSSSHFLTPAFRARMTTQIVHQPLTSCNNMQRELNPQRVSRKQDQPHILPRLTASVCHVPLRKFPRAFLVSANPGFLYYEILLLASFRRISLLAFCSAPSLSLSHSRII